MTAGGSERPPAGLPHGSRFPRGDHERRQLRRIDLALLADVHLAELQRSILLENRREAGTAATGPLI